MFAVDDVAVAGDGDEDVADPGGLSDRHHAEAVHHGLDRLDRIDLGDDDVRAHAAGTHRDAFAAPAVADDDQVAAGEQNVRRANDAVERRLARAVAIVEEMFGLRVVDGDRREGEHAGLRHRFEADDAGRRFFGRADDLVLKLGLFLDHRRDDVRAVVDDEVGFVLECRLHVTAVGLGGLALYRQTGMPQSATSEAATSS